MNWSRSGCYRGNERHIAPDGNIGLEVTDQSTIPDDPSVEIDGPSQIKIYLKGQMVSKE